MALSLLNINAYARLIKFSHSIFALPFALSMFVIVTREYSVAWNKLAWIIVALVAARSMAMGFNRVVDRNLDALNPRTSERELPSGVLQVQSVNAFVVGSAGLFLLSSYMLGTHCLWLAPLVVAVLLGYSWTKRFTAYSHVVLGICLALAPGGVWYALTAQFAWIPVYMMCAVALWVAGFDIIYACQDVVVDRAQGLFSIPATLGVESALQLARLFHLTAIVFLIGFAMATQAGMSHYLGLTIFAVLLASQHGLVRPNSLSRIDQAFFERNGLASVVYFLGVLLDRI